MKEYQKMIKSKYNNKNELLVCICPVSTISKIWESILKKHLSSYIDIAIINQVEINKNSVYPQLIYILNNQEMLKTYGYLSPMMVIKKIEQKKLEMMH